MFGRATIRLGIGPHSSWLYLLLHAVSCGWFCFWHHQSVIFLFVYEISQEPVKFTRKMCLVPRSVEFGGQKSRSPGTKNDIFSPFCGLRAVSVS